MQTTWSVVAGHLWKRLQILFGCLELLHGPVLAFGIGLAIPFSSQVMDVFRIDAADAPRLFADRLGEVLGSYAFTAVTVLMAALFIYLCARMVTLSPQADLTLLEAEDLHARQQMLAVLPPFLGSFYVLSYVQVVLSALEPTVLTRGSMAVTLVFMVLIVLVLLLFVFGRADAQPTLLDRALVRVLFLPQPEPRPAPAPAPEPAGIPGAVPARPFPLTFRPPESDARKLVGLLVSALSTYSSLLAGIWRALAQWSIGSRPGDLRRCYGPASTASKAAPAFAPPAAPVRVSGPASAPGTHLYRPVEVRDTTVADIGNWIEQWASANIGLTWALAAKFLGIAVVVTVVPLLALASVLALILPVPIIVAQTIGTIAVSQLFVIVLALLLSLRPLRAVVVAWVVFALALSLADLNDSHHVARLPGRPQAQAALPESFDNWLRARGADTWKSPGPRYPVYVVAARGGGIYAAYHTAMVLARLQDLCPDFAAHVFAISAVSGGSLGAAAFAALAQEEARAEQPRGCVVPDSKPPRPPGPLEARARAVLSADFLAPTVAGLLFADVFTQAFPNCAPLPWCLDGLDRARALEQSFEDAYARHLPAGADNPFARSFYRQWKPDGAAPALLVNATEVETGERVVIAPFAPASAPAQDLRNTLLARAPDLDLRLSTAAGISARFPLISPAAAYRLADDPRPEAKRRLVDGGYADNSGIATALDTIEVMVKVARQRDLPVDIHLIVLSGVPKDPDPGYAFGELASPLRALVHIRDEQGRRTEELAHRTLLDGNGNGTVKTGIRYLHLDAEGLKLPLGWRLSEQSRIAIDAQLGWPGRPCEDASVTEQLAGAAKNPAYASSCTMQRIVADLTPLAAAAPRPQR